MRNGKLVLLLTVFAIVWPGAGGLVAHEAALQSAEAQAAGTRISPAPPFAETYGKPGARAALEAANALLGALSPEQADTIVLPLDSPLRGQLVKPALRSNALRAERAAPRRPDARPARTGVRLSRRGAKSARLRNGHADRRRRRCSGGVAEGGARRMGGRQLLGSPSSADLRSPAPGAGISAGITWRSTGALRTDAR